MLISEDYRSFNRAMHEADGTWGDGDPWFNNLVSSVANLIKAEGILDYGAGKRTLEASVPSVTSYDPAIPEIAGTPSPADLVVSRCVLEHVEPECLDAVLDDMRRCSLKAALLVVSCFPSSKTLPDGRNVHLIIEPLDWWLPHLMKRWKVNTAQRLPFRRFWFLGSSKP